MARTRNDRRPDREAGIVLITALIFMVVLTLIVLALMRSATLEERMASNARDRQVALQAAEAVLRDAQVFLFEFSGPPPDTTPVEPFNIDGFTDGDCTSGFCRNLTVGAALQKPNSWWIDTGITRTFAVPADSNLSGVATQPSYVVEFLWCEYEKPNKPKFVVFRVTARGVGRDSAKVFLESMVRYEPFKFKKCTPPPSS